jgi:putative FmdB family regulatory protein
MPIYEYRCAACGFQKEYLQRMSDAPLTDCPECGKPQFSKMVTAAGFQLKGSGWYATDFKNGSKPAPAADKVAADSATKKDDSKKESKAEAACGAGACPACT